jgi:LAS superfamily LD-carboxypeptidase LdcB
VVDVHDHSGIQMHRHVISPIQQLMVDAKKAGFELRIASGFRDFKRQRLIWNRKCRGELPVLDRQGQPLDVSSMTALEKVTAILHWSALPGGSRHHWGTDCDIYDAAAIPADYALALHPDEYNKGGLFAPMMNWLTDYFQQPLSPAFYRPYDQCHKVTDGVAPEPWHLSYRPVALHYEKKMKAVLLRQYLQQLQTDEQLDEQQTVLEYLDEIYQRFIQLRAS